ncbi:MAG: VWA domain-containing protein [Pirellulaceae bacterium]
MMPAWAQLEFTHPGRLLLLAAIPIFLYLSLRDSRRCALTVIGAMVRAAVVAVLILAFAGPVQMLPGFAKHVVLAVDFSESTAGSRGLVDAYVAELAAAADTKTSVVVFGTEEDISDFPESFDVHRIKSRQSNPAEAVLLADTLAPDGSRSEILLMTDGRQTAGDLAKAVQGVRAPISVAPLAPFAEAEVCLLRLRMLSDSPTGDETLLEATILANQAGSGQLHLSAEGTPIAAQAIELARGVQHVVLPALINRRRVAVVTGELVGFEDTFAANNRRRVVAAERRAMRVLVVGREPQRLQSFVGGLSAHGIEVTTVPLAEAALQAEALRRYDVVVLSDIPDAALHNLQQDDDRAPEAAFDALDTYVREGGGLVVVGGNATFGVESLAGTPLETLLPLKSSPREAERKPTLALVLVIDKSKSMLEDNRLELAKAAARQTVDVLEPNDKVGVIAFGTDNAWVSEIIPSGDKRQLNQRIGTLTAEGQTDMYPALEKAYLALEQADADRRHAIVLTDGVSTPGDFGEVARRMADGGITVSTVSISPGAEQQILKDIARIAGGEHYHCDQPADIADILVRDTRRVEADALEFRPIVHQSLADLDVTGAPPLLGFAPTSPHGDAQLLLRSEGGDPLLAWRRHGLGMVAAFPADVQGDWSARWLRWPGFAAFWTRLVTFAGRRERHDARLQLVREGDRARVVLQAHRDGAPLNGLEPRAQVADLNSEGLTDAPSRTLMLAQTAPGRYEAPFEVELDASYEVQVEFHDDQRSVKQAIGGSYDYRDELRVGPAEDSLLRTVVAQSGGRYAPPPSDIAAGGRAPRNTPTALWRYFLLAAAVLLVVDLGVRRFPHVLSRRQG